jgi:hypothetical protein
MVHNNPRSYSISFIGRKMLAYLEITYKHLAFRPTPLSRSQKRG